MPNEDNKTLEYNHGEKSLKSPFFYWFWHRMFTKKICSIQNNPNKSYTVKKAEHEPSGCAWSIWLVYLI